jgi:hypothetical protein
LTAVDAKAGGGAGAMADGRLAFITGCGRSGTTILGQILSHHPQVRYLNDRFDVWVEPLAVTDIWGQREMRAGLAAESDAAAASGCTARVELTADDARRLSDEERRRFLGRLESERGGRPLLVEKLAINNFRLNFLMELCPGALLINIRRHGVEVARSIEQKAKLGHWYGLGDRKWGLLREHAEARGYGHLLPLCTGAYEKGLLEWRMSVEAAEEFLARAGERAETGVLRLTYEALIADAARVALDVQEFLGLSPDQAVQEFCTREVRRLNPAAHEREIPTTTEPIAGETLRRLGYTF